MISSLFLFVESESTNNLFPHNSTNIIFKDFGFKTMNLFTHHGMRGISKDSGFKTVNSFSI